ncbi:alpha-(1,3)-fucosyltransferase C isoform X1 [Amyelois transitella]|uniref:alpha-(1,3)-fucosyltransferase C isoform X1 n=2 Tax=Amyelois transitella TaxID=680683 RepID=UPI002990048E|nr:alpha-(1,3)-fucosyltransferase C isoform X1 [Amyelois transitella]
MFNKMENININRSSYLGKGFIIICILAFVVYMYYAKYLIEENYNWKWNSNDLTDLKTNYDMEYPTSDDAITSTIEGQTKDRESTTLVSISQTVTETTNKTTTVDIEKLRRVTILQWSSGRNSPFYHMGRQNINFIKLSCPFSNCYVTDYKRYFKSFNQFDAILFNGNFVIYKDKNELPQDRSPTQMYVFGATESAHNNPACKPVLDNFFNWTYTYRLDSDVRWSYILIYDKNGTEVGPKSNMSWPKEMDPIDENTKSILDGKSKTAAWFVSHCNTLSKRENFAKEVEKELQKIDDNMSVDVYGSCGKFDCPRSSADRCYGLVKKDYYFYFSFENSFAVDYVTEKLLTALNNFAVPVVYGGADYSRYLPPGSYLNGLELGPEKLAITMKEIIDNKTRYYDFFRWRNHFTYKQGENDTEICNICTALNDPEKVAANSVYEDFRDWWYPEWRDHHKCKK